MILDDFHAAACRIEAFRQAKARQRGVRLDAAADPWRADAPRFTAPACEVATHDFTLECCCLPSPDPAAAGRCTIFNRAVRDAADPAFFALTSGVEGGDARFCLRLGGMSEAPGVTVPLAGKPFHLAVTRSGPHLRLYVDGALLTEVELPDTRDFGRFEPAAANTPCMRFVRRYDRALTQDEVAAHFNDGDPAGFVLPAADGCAGEYLAQNLVPTSGRETLAPAASLFEFRADSPYYMAVVPTARYDADALYRVEYVVEAWRFAPQTYGVVGFLGVNGAQIVEGIAGWYSEQGARIGEAQRFLVRLQAAGSPGLFLYGGNANAAATQRHLRVRINDIRLVPEAAVVWLDAAPQRHDGAYLPPLTETAGGGDMISTGAPEIQYLQP